jgi:serine/threonine-protein kinase
MTPERWQEVSRIYHDALACDPRGRDAFVREACAGDEGVRQEVESLLAQPASRATFLAGQSRDVDADRTPAGGV